MPHLTENMRLTLAERDTLGQTEIGKGDSASTMKHLASGECCRCAAEVVAAGKSRVLTRVLWEFSIRVSAAFECFCWPSVLIIFNELLPKSTSVTATGAPSWEVQGTGRRARRDSGNRWIRGRSSVAPARILKVRFSALDLVMRTLPWRQ